MAERQPKFRETGPVLQNSNTYVPNRLLRKDVGAASRFPGEVGVGSRTLDGAVVYSSSTLSVAAMIEEASRFPDGGSKVIKLPYLQKAGAGTFTATVSLDLPTITPLSVWYLGHVYFLNGITLTANPGGVRGSMMSGATMDIDDTGGSGTARYYYDKSSLSIKITSVNIGIADTLCAYFYVASYYDEPKVQVVGL